MKTRTHNSRKAGFTLVEAAIAAVILIVLTGSLTQSTSALRGIAGGGSVQDQLQAASIKAANRIVADLKCSGVQGDYPQFIVNGVPADADFTEYAHTPATKTAEDQDYDYGQDSEIVFQRPADDDDDGVPDIDGAGALVWDATEYSYQLVTSAQGVNELVRRVDNANPEVIARHVERLVFEDASPTTMKKHVIRVKIYFRQTDAQGKLYKYSVELVVKLQNA